MHPSTQRILDFIVDYKRTHDGNSPAVREICDGIPISSTSLVFYHLRRLGEIGYIRETDHSKRTVSTRSIELVGGRWRYVPPEAR